MEVNYHDKRAGPLQRSEVAAFIRIISPNQGSPASGLLIRESEAMSVSICKGIHSKIRSESHAIRELRNYSQLCGPV